MRFALISDIHGNYPALDMIIKDAANLDVDGYIFAGDYCISAPWPKDVINKLMSLQNSYAVLGNEEKYLHLPQGDDGQSEVSYWAQRQLSKEQMAWLDALPRRIDTRVEDVEIHICHPSSEFIGQCEYKFGKTSLLAMHYGDRTATHEENLEYVRSQLLSDNEFTERARALDKGVYIFGHSHDQFYIEFEGRWFINPGSCGLPLDCCEFGFPYSILTLDDGDVKVEERRIPYDPEKLIALAKETSQFREAHVWSEIIFREWRTCKEAIRFFLNNAEAYANSIGDSRRPFAKETWEAAYLDWKDKVEKSEFEISDDGQKLRK